MKYYSIETSLSKKILGHYPQVKNIIYNCHVWDEPKFIEHVHFEKIDFEPIMANAVLHPKSKHTDLIDITGMGFTLKPLVSSKLKNILENNRKTGLQFFKSPVYHQEKIIQDYYILNMYENNNNLIEIKKCRVQYHKKSDDYESTYNTNTEYLTFENFESFSSFLNIAIRNNEFFFIDKLFLKDEINEDFFMLQNVQGSVKYVVSEKLKKEIEEANCTGIEFQPIELSLTEWLHGGEREKIYGKT
ncbi:imm11 family protein [Flavobacterium sp. WG21]|uniref:imm11 family protein n=1 Tax=Flavobacterium sp. WG21 TaxID=1229487 RepID=UPI00034A61F9|nr:DUF1629 domain-containing protein [Flavobacterium sp. WG21]